MLQSITIYSDLLYFHCGEMLPTYSYAAVMCHQARMCGGANETQISRRIGFRCTARCALHLSGRRDFGLLWCRQFYYIGWLSETVGRGTVLFYIGLYTHDIIVNVLLAAPFAAVFVLFRRLDNWPCVLLAVLASLVVTYGGLEWSFFVNAAQLPFAWMGLSTQLISLPIAFAVGRAIRNRASGAGSEGDSHGRSCRLTSDCDAASSRRGLPRRVVADHRVESGDDFSDAGGERDLLVFAGAE